MVSGNDDYRAVGIEVNERAANPTVQGAQYGIAGFIGETRRGDLDKHNDVYSWEEFVRKYGGGSRNGYYKNTYGEKDLPYAVREFFRKNKGRIARIVRVLSANNSAAASGTFRGLNGSSDSIKITAKNKGDWGNYLSFSTIKYSTITTGSIANGATEATLQSVVDVELGDFIHITDGSTSVDVYVKAIDASNKKIKFSPVSLSATIASGATVSCATRHLCKTSLAEDLTNGATSVEVVDATGIVVGSRLYIGKDGIDEDVEVVVTAVNGNTISFSAVSLSSTITKTDSVVASIEFSLYVYDENEHVESWEGLSLEPTNEINYVEERLLGNNNPSDYITVEDENYVKTTYKSEDIPILNGTSIKTAATYVPGSDGDQVTESDVIGSSISPKTGLYLLDGVEVDIVCAPGFNAGEVTKAGLAWAKARKDTIFVHSHPLSADTVEEIRNHKSKVINYPTSYGAMYSPWIEIKDPIREGKTLYVDPTGWVAAEAAYVARTFGLHYAPANTQLDGDIVGLTMNLSDSDNVKLGVLNHDGINVIRHFEGAGYRIFGARTESMLHNGFHWLNVRIYTNWVKRTLKRYLMQYAIKPNMQSFRALIQEGIYDFFEDEWKAGHLVPEDDETKAFFVQCDSRNNPDRLVRRGYLVIDAGFNPPPPAEFIVLNISLFSGNVSIAESTVRNM